MVALRLCPAQTAQRHSRETKQNTKQNPEFEEAALMKVTADRMERGFLFHWIIMVVVKTVRGVTTRVLFLPVILTSLGSKSGTPFYLNRRKRVNTILKLLATHPLFLEAQLRTSGQDVPRTQGRRSAGCNWR